MIGSLNPPAVFLDRDGTLNVDVGYPDTLEKIQLIPGAVEAVRMFNQMERKVIIVSNQSGIARGFFDEERLMEIHQGMKKMFGCRGAMIDDFYYCPYHPNFGSLEDRRKAAQYRKPNPAMYYQAVKDYQLDLQASVMIGDKYTDIEAGKRLGMASVLVLTGVGAQEHHQYKDDDCLFQPDLVCKDILEAAQQLQMASLVSQSSRQKKT